IEPTTAIACLGYPSVTAELLLKSGKQPYRQQFQRRRLSGLLEELSADEHAPDLGGSGTDLIKFRIAKEPAGREVVDVAIAAKGLDGLERHRRCLLGGKENDARGVFARRLPAIASAGDGVDVRAGGAQRHIHVRKLALHELECADGLSELLALMNVRKD